MTPVLLALLPPHPDPCLSPPRGLATHLTASERASSHSVPVEEPSQTPAPRPLPAVPPRGGHSQEHNPSAGKVPVYQLGLPIPHIRPSGGHFIMIL